jgi:hypothetical protein
VTKSQKKLANDFVNVLKQDIDASDFNIYFLSLPILGAMPVITMTVSVTKIDQLLTFFGF